MARAGKKTDDSALSTRERILLSSERLFAEKGFAGTAIRDIAADVGLNPASLYNHFPGKQELYEAVLDRALAPVAEIVREIAEAGEGETDLMIIDRIVDHFARRPEWATLLQHETLAGGESITRLAGRWLAPIYEQALGAIRRSPGVASWQDEDLPLLICGMHNMVLGYFSMAPFLERMLGQDPRSPEALDRQKLFLRQAAARMLGREV